MQQGLSGGYEPTDLAYQPPDERTTMMLPAVVVPDAVLPDGRAALDRFDSVAPPRAEQVVIEHRAVGHARSERVTFERVTVEHITTEYVAAEYVPIDHRVTENPPASERLPSEWRLGEQRESEYRAAEYRAADYRAADYRAADYRAAEYRPAPPGYLAANHPPGNHGPGHRDPAVRSPAAHRDGPADPTGASQLAAATQSDATAHLDVATRLDALAPGAGATSHDRARSGHDTAQPWPIRQETVREQAGRPDVIRADAGGTDAHTESAPHRSGRRHPAGDPSRAKPVNNSPIIPSPATSAPGSPAPAGAADYAPTPREPTSAHSAPSTRDQDQAKATGYADTASALSGGPLTGNAPPDYNTPDNAPPLTGAGGLIPVDRARNRAIDRHWSPERNSSGAVRPASRPFVRIPGRHAAMSRRQAWETRYVRTLLACDLLVGIAAGAAAFGVRFGDEVTTYNRAYVVLSLLLPMVLLLVLAFSRAYERRFLFVGTDEYQRVIRGGVFLIAGVAVSSYALDLDLARSYVLAALPAAVAASVLLRFALRKRLHRSRAGGKSLRRVIVVGHELAVVGITRQLKREAYHGLEVVGACLPPRHDGNVNLPVYGTFDDVAEAVEAAAADTVLVLSCPELDGVVLRRLAWKLERDEVDLIVASALIDVAGARTTIRPVDGLPMLHVEHPRLHGGARLVKETIDRVGALALTVLLGPLLLGVALCVRLTSPGPVLFRQVRVGRDGREFRIFKFRSMYVDAEARLAELRHLNEHDGLLFKIRDDPRVTPVGRWLRRLSLDELPQLLNVVAGQMSLVGPRPPLPVEVAAYADDVRRRLAVKPGMTGLWQVSGRSDLPWEEAVRLDLRYVENWSLSLDLVILLRTMTAVVRSSGAY